MALVLQECRCDATDLTENIVIEGRFPAEQQIQTRRQVHGTRDGQKMVQGVRG